jgi:hypothetical protein
MGPQRKEDIMGFKKATANAADAAALGAATAAAENDQQPELDTSVGREYIVVSDTTSEVIMSDKDWVKVRSTARMIRKAGGAVTIFAATKG